MDPCDSSTNTPNLYNCWIPIESDPEIMTDYLKMISLSNRYLVDLPVIDAAEEFGIFEYHNVLAYIFLYQCSRNVDMGIVETDPEKLDGLFYMKQYNQNACGSVALFHAFINTIPKDQLESSSLIGRFFNDAAFKNPEERGQLFASDANIFEMHKNAATQGQSSIPSEQALSDIDYHFVAYIWYNGSIFELDGRKDGPINHGNATKEQFPTETLKVLKQQMQRDPNNLHFSVMALCSPK